MQVVIPKRPSQPKEYAKKIAMTCVKENRVSLVVNGQHLSDAFGNLLCLVVSMYTGVLSPSRGRAVGRRLTL